MKNEKVFISGLRQAVGCPVMNIWEEGFCLEYIGRMECVVRDILDLLAQKHTGKMAELTLALSELAEDCRDGIERFGLWREDERSLYEIVDRIDAKASLIFNGIGFFEEIGSPVSESDAVVEAIGMHLPRLA